MADEMTAETMALEEKAGFDETPPETKPHPPPVVEPPPDESKTETVPPETKPPPPPVVEPPPAKTAADEAEARAATLEREESERLVREAAEKQRREQAEQDGKPKTFDVKATLSSLVDRLDKMGLTFPNPDDSKTDRVGIKDLVKDAPAWLVELTVAMAHMMGEEQYEERVAPIAKSFEQQEADRQYKSWVAKLEDPNGEAKLPAGAVDQIFAHKEFDTFFQKDRPGLNKLLESDNPSDVAMALRAFAEAKGIKLEAQAAAPTETEEQKAAREAAEQKRKHGQELHRNGAGGGAPRAPTRATPEEEEAAAWREGQEADKAGK